MSSSGTDYLLAHYEALKQETDPLADHTARFIVDNNRFKRVNDLFEHLIRNDDFHPEQEKATLSATSLEYLERSRELPAFFSAAKVDMGEHIYSRYGPECMTALLFKALPAGYTHWHVAETLAITGRMRVETDKDLRLTRRILETLQFVLYVMEEGGLTDPGKRGIAAIQKVRLIHATIRIAIQEDEHWRPDWPKPLNQLELAMTMLTFSLLVIDGMKQMGVTLEEEEEEGVLHLWKVVGAMLGTREELMPRDMADARAMWELIDEREKRRTDAGIALTDALIYYGKTIMPWRVLNFVPSILILFYSGPERARLLGVKGRFSLLQWLCLELVRLGVAVVSAVARRWPAVQRLLRRFHMALLTELLSKWNERYWHVRKGVNFFIPPSLRADWTMPMSKLTPPVSRGGGSGDTN